MPANRLPTSAAIGHFLKDRRKSLGYTLRDVETLSGNAGKLIPFSTLSRIEKGVLDPGLPRLQQLLRVYHVPLQAAGDLLDLEEFAGELPDEADPERLHRMGVDAWRAGDARGALAAFMAMKRVDAGADPVLRQKALLSLSSISAMLGKYEFAKHVVEGLLRDKPDPTILVSVLVQAARCWQWLGGAEVALALIERAESRLSPSDPPHREAFVFHQKASVLVDRHEFQAADAALAKALGAYRRANDEDGYCRALGVRIRTHFEKGRPADALQAAQAARLYAKRHGLERHRLLYTIEEARACLLLDDVTACLVHLGHVLAAAVDRDDRVVRFYTHYYYWRAFEKAGDPARAGAEFDSAAQQLAFIDEVTPEAEHVRELLSRRRAPKAGSGRGY